MQTFLPYPDYRETAKVLDYRRLGKQRLEAYQIIKILTGKTHSKYSYHPAVRMWAGYQNNLIEYYNTIVEEWISRGYKNTMPRNLEFEKTPRPLWIFDERFYISHQSNLLRKDSLYYGKYFIGIPDDLPYFWPSHEEEYRI